MAIKDAVSPGQKSPYHDPFKKLFTNKRPSHANSVVSTEKVQSSQYSRMQSFRLEPKSQKISAQVTKRQNIEEVTKKKVEGLTKIIWNCSNLIDKTNQEKKGINTIEQYYSKEYKDLDSKYKTIHGVNNFLSYL